MTSWSTTVGKICGSYPLGDYVLHFRVQLRLIAVDEFCCVFRVKNIPGPCIISLLEAAVFVSRLTVEETLKRSPVSLLPLHSRRNTKEDPSELNFALVSMPFVSVYRL